jgi:two-component system alkaline phosphatase synthesis response regulator PhoP/two-component system response regulator VicR
MTMKILAVDDERSVIRLIQVNLERAGYEVAAAYDGREALEKIGQEKPDLIILDVMMPFVDGFEVLRNVKANPETNGIPVIMLTVRAQDADILHGYETGAVRYLTKPFGATEIVTAVTDVLGPSGSVGSRQ